jgi:hypothetical protein
MAITARFGKIGTKRKKPPRLPTSATERRINRQRSIITGAMQLTGRIFFGASSLGAAY